MQEPCNSDKAIREVRGVPSVEEEGPGGAEGRLSASRACIWVPMPYRQWGSMELMKLSIWKDSSASSVEMNGVGANLGSGR